MIWKKEHIPSTYRASAQQAHFDWATSPVPSINKETPTIAIAGGGPKGCYALQAIVNEYKCQDDTTPIQILWFNQDEHFASGPNYAVDQPDYLLINYCIGHIQAWDPDTRHDDHTHTLLDWISAHADANIVPSPLDYASRAVVGLYLQDTLRTIINELPKGIRLIPVIGTILSLHHTGNRLVMETASRSFTAESVLMATGHCYDNAPVVKGDNLPADNYIRAAYPLTRLDHILPKSRVGMVGQGLTFIDAALYLTEGRGGKFSENYTYQPSGMEPVIYPFSRTNALILCRPPSMPNENTFIAIDEKWMAEIKHIADTRKIDFETEVLPKIAEEIQFAYYASHWKESRVDVLKQRLMRLPEKERFTITDLLQWGYPTANTAMEQMPILDAAIREAEAGEQSPFIAAASTWRKIAPLIAALYKAGGFTGQSQRKLDNYYFAAFNRVCYGPPIQNIKKIHALAAAGFIQFSPVDASSISWSVTDTCFTSAPTNRETQGFDYIIDARIARPSIQQQNAALYTNLFANHTIRPFQNEDYLPGCADMDKNGKALSAGKKDALLYFYGSCTEGVFFDNDTLSPTKNNTAKHWAEDTLQNIRKRMPKSKETNYEYE